MEEEQFFENHSEDADENPEEENQEIDYEAYQQNQNDDENQENEEVEMEEIEKAPEESIEEKIIVQKEKNPLRIKKTEEITTTKVTKTLKSQKNSNPKKTTVTKNIKEKKEYLKPKTNFEERTKNVIYSNKNSRVNSTIENKIYDTVDQKNHQFYSSYFSKKNNVPQSNNSYSKYSSKINRKSSTNSVDNLYKPKPQNLRSNNNNNSYISQNYYIPSSQTTKVRHTKLINGCVRCPNCNFIFNPNENYNKYENRSYIVEKKPEKKYYENVNYNYNLNRKNEIKNIPFDTFSNKKTIQTTIETKTNYNPNIYTNERGTTVFTQPKRKVQVIRKSFGADGEVLEEEINDGEERRGIGSRFSYGSRNLENNGGYYESYGSRDNNRSNQGYRYVGFH